MHLLIPLLAHFDWLAKIDLQRVIDWMDIGWPAYLVLFGLLFSCGLGVPIPEDVPLLVAGMLCRRGSSDMIWPAAAVVGWMGIIGGDCCLYYFGHRFGLNITKVPLIGHHVTRERIVKAERLFEKYGVWVVAVGRMFAGIRGAMVVAAGTIRFNFAKFIIADGLAALFSGGLFLFLGYKFAEHLFEVEQAIKHAGGWILLALVVAGLVWLTYVWWRHERHATPSQLVMERVAEHCPDPADPHACPPAAPVTEPSHPVP